MINNYLFLIAIIMFCCKAFCIIGTFHQLHCNSCKGSKPIMCGKVIGALLISALFITHSGLSRVFILSGLCMCILNTYTPLQA